MRITVELPPELETRLRDSAMHQDRESIQQLLVEAIAPTVEALLRESAEALSDEEFEAAADQLANELSGYLGPDRAPLSDAAVSREGIYEGHP